MLPDHVPSEKGSYQGVWERIRIRPSEKGSYQDRLRRDSASGRLGKELVSGRLRKESVSARLKKDSYQGIASAMPSARKH